MINSFNSAFDGAWGQKADGDTPVVPPTGWGPLLKDLGTTLNSNVEISLVAGNGILFYGPYAGQMTQSVNEAVTWTDVANKPAVDAVCGLFTGGRHIMFGHQGKYTYTDNNGTTWVEGNIGSSVLISCCATDGAGTIVVGVPTGVHVSYNNGTSFTFFKSTPGANSALCVAYASGYWYVIVDTVGLQRTDLVDWETVSGTPSFGFKGTLVANGDGTLTFHADGFSRRVDGTTLSYIPDMLPRNYAYGSYSDGTGIVIMGDDYGNVVLSSNYGITWSDLPQFLNSGGSSLSHGVLSAITSMSGKFYATFRTGWSSISPPLT